MRYPEIVIGLLLCLGLGHVEATIPPPPSQTFPDALLQRFKDPNAFEFKQSYLAQVQRTRNNAQAFLAGTMSLEAAKVAGGTVVSGTRAIPVILMTYSDAQAQPYTPASLQCELFDGPWPTGTMSDYYKEVSYGNLRVTGTVFPWTLLPKTASYYQGADYQKNGKTEHCYGVCPTSHLGEMLQAALASVDKQIDFSRYDNDGPDGVPNSGDDDGFVDFVAFVQPSRGGECLDGNPGVWSHRYNLSDLGSGHFATNDAKSGGGAIAINDYVIEPALACDGKTMIQIGVFVHEFGHAFGLPELDDTSSNPRWEGAGVWDVMASGSWGGDGKSPERPTHMSVWAKESLGWVAPTAVTQSKKNVALHAIEKTPEAFQQNLSSTQRYLSEYRAKSGFDRNLPAAGIIVWKVNDTVVNAGLKSNRVNADVNNRGVMVLAADGKDGLGNPKFRGGPGDPFPGSSGKRAIDGTTRPGMLGSVAVCAIGDPAATITASFHTQTGKCPAAAAPVAVVPASSPVEVPIAEIRRNGLAFEQHEVIVKGTLHNAGTNYFTDRKLELQDEKGHRLPVSVRQVTETAPPPPDRSGDGPQTLSNLLDKQIVITGTVRSAKGDPSTFVLDAVDAKPVQ